MSIKDTRGKKGHSRVFLVILIPVCLNFHLKLDRFRHMQCAVNEKLSPIDGNKASHSMQIHASPHSKVILDKGKGLVRS